MEPAARPSPLNRHVFKIIPAAVGLLVLLGGLFVVVPLFSGPTLKAHLVDDWLAGCAPGDVRFVCNGTPRYYHLMGYVDFGKDIIGIGGDDFENGGITLTIVQGSMESVPITNAQKPDLQKLIAALPSRQSLLWGYYDFDTNLYFACWRGGQLRYFVYPKSDLPSEVKELFKFFEPSSVEELEK